jgi:prefoldin subunit 5
MRVKFAASCALEALELASIASRVRILQAENESLKRQLDRIEAAQ